MSPLTVKVTGGYGSLGSTASRPTNPSLGMVRLARFDASTIVDAWLDGEPVAAPAGSGWQTVQRDGSVAFVEYAGGFDPDRMTVPVMLDGWSSRTSVQRDWDALMEMYTAPGPGIPPARVVVTGSLPWTARTWVIERLEPVEGSLMPDGVTLMRQRAVLTLLDPTAADTAVDPVEHAKAKAKSKTKPSAKTRRVPVRPGDTLQALAVRYLGDAGRAHELQVLNGIRDPDHLTVKQIRLP